MGLSSRIYNVQEKGPGFMVQQVFPPFLFWTAFFVLRDLTEEEEKNQEGNAMTLHILSIAGKLVKLMPLDSALRNRRL